MSVASICSVPAYAAPSPIKVDPKNQVLSVSPVIIRTELSPGSSSTQRLTLANQTPRSLSLRLQAVSLKPGSESGLETRVDPNESPSGITVTPAPKQLTLEPGDERKVPVTIRTSGSQPGGYSGALLVIVAPEDDETVAIQTQIEVLVLVNVVGKVDRKVTASIQSVRPLWLRSSRKPSVRIRNEGEVHERLDIQISEDRLLGADGRTRLQDVTVMRGAARRLPFTLQQGALPDVISLTVTARDHVVAKGKNRSVRDMDSQRIFVVPIWFVAGLVAVVLVLIWRIRVIRDSR